MTEEPPEPNSKTNGFGIILLGSVMLPLVIVGFVVLLGQDWATSDEARYYDYILIGAVIVIFASDWIKDQPVWKRAPRWLRENRYDALLFVGLAAYIGWQDADPTLTGAAWWRSFGAEFLIMLVLFAAFYMIWTVIRERRNR